MHDSINYHDELSANAQHILQRHIRGESKRGRHRAPSPSSLPTPHKQDSVDLQYSMLQFPPCPNSINQNEIIFCLTHLKEPKDSKLNYAFPSPIKPVVFPNFDNSVKEVAGESDAPKNHQSRSHDLSCCISLSKKRY